MFLSCLDCCSLKIQPKINLVKSLSDNNKTTIFDMCINIIESIPEDENKKKKILKLFFDSVGIFFLQITKTTQFVQD